MINPTFKEVITHYHQKRSIDTSTNRTQTEWIRTVYCNCFFGTHEAESLSGNTLSQASSYIVRIPFIGERMEFSSGDVIFLGEIKDIPEDSAGKRISDLIGKYKPDCFTVRTIADNTKISYGAHYKLTGA